MKKTTRIVIDIETDFKPINGKDFGDGDEEDDFTKEVTDSFHDKVFDYFERIVQEDDDFEGDILMGMGDDGNLPKNVMEFCQLGSVMIKIGQEEVDGKTD